MHEMSEGLCAGMEAIRREVRATSVRPRGGSFASSNGPYNDPRLALLSEGGYREGPR
jgi:hypothetical protein